MTQLIIAEKPSAAAKIATALGPATLKKQGTVSWFEIPDKKIYVASAVGHLYTLTCKERGYPVFGVEWTPTFEKSKSAAFAKKYHTVLTKLAKKCTEFVVATDFDIEGEVIGLNIVRFICKKKDAYRMKFSTLMKEDLIEAYKTKLNTLDWGQARAGETRHTLDWYYGINLSKAAMSAVTLAKNRYVPLSIGRIQGPSLALLAEREREIAAFKPVPYWQIFADVQLKTGEVEAIHIEDKFWDEYKAKQIYKKVKDKPATIAKIAKTKQAVYPPFPFDLTSLQIEAYRCLRISPKRTLSAAQELYTAALISYPRTSSQKLPAKLGFKNILTKLGKNPKYSLITKQVLKTSLRPNEGKKSDPAHPAIYPTGAVARGLDGDAAKVYDLIVKRFFSVFGEAGERESTKIGIFIEKEPFVMSGIITTKLGWQKWYQPYSEKKEFELPPLNVGEVYAEKTRIKKDETKPPKRYTPASVIKALEKANLGTKATRANIIEILRDRGYIQGTPIVVTELGLKVIDTFAKYAPTILSKELTRKFEEEMQQIRESKKKPELVLADAQKVITKICEDFKAHKQEIGDLLGDAFITTQNIKNTLCSCSKCKKGSMRVLTSRKTRKRFLACNEYPKCKTTWGMPQKGTFSFLKTSCKCGTPFAQFYTRGRKPWRVCLNPDCEFKEPYDPDKAKEEGKKTKKD
jgi:DNA topoisomerase I